MTHTLTWNLQGVSKGLAAQPLLSTMVERGRPPDFVLCIGDDRSDEDMFASIASAMAQPSMASIVEVFACTVGQKPSKAKYYLDDTVEASIMLIATKCTSMGTASQERWQGFGACSSHTVYFHITGCKGTGKRKYSGTNRYLGDLGHTMKTAWSNVLFAAMREVSDSVVNGAETSGIDGMVNGFRRGILKLAMEPSVLSTAAVRGGSTYRIKLEHMDELYIGGYLQAMLDALFKQNYLRVKVVDDQVLLKNLPPNTILMNEIKQCVKNFLIGEGLLAGESS